MNKKLLRILFICFIMTISNSFRSFSQENNTVQTMPLGSKPALSGKELKKKSSHRNNRPNGKFYIENNEKKKKIKTKIKITHSDYCPTYTPYHSKLKLRREKMLQKNR